MIKSFTITNYVGEVITIELTRPNDTGFVVESCDGLGPAGANINTTDVATNDGGLFNSAYLNQRNIVLNLIFSNELNDESIEDLRHKTYQYFPEKKWLNFAVETDTRHLQIDGYVEHNEPDIFSDQEGAQISIICPYPYFKADQGSSAEFGSVYAIFEFPFSNECLWEEPFDDSILDNFGIQIQDSNGEDINNSSVYTVNRVEDKICMSHLEFLKSYEVFYDGDAEVGFEMLIHVTGTVLNPVIYKMNTRETFSIDTDKLAEMTGYPLMKGDDVIISTLKGSKSVTLIREGDRTNILNCVPRDVDWFQLSKGTNLFAFTAEYGVSKLSFVLNYTNIYEGV